ncbi:hypothetical protein LIZ82_16880, partial [[Eubacterium] rectale]
LHLRELRQSVLFHWRIYIFFLMTAMASASMLTHGQNNRCAFLFFPFYHKLTINHQFFDIFLSPTVKQPLNISLYRGIKIRARSTIYTHNFNIFNMVFFHSSIPP